MVFGTGAGALAGFGLLAPGTAAAADQQGETLGAMRMRAVRRANGSRSPIVAAYTQARDGEGAAGLSHASMAPDFGEAAFGEAGVGGWGPGQVDEGSRSRNPDGDAQSRGHRLLSTLRSTPVTETPCDE